MYSIVIIFGYLDIFTFRVNMKMAAGPTLRHNQLRPQGVMGNFSLAGDLGPIVPSMACRVWV